MQVIHFWLIVSRYVIGNVRPATRLTFAGKKDYFDLISLISYIGTEQPAKKLAAAVRISISLLK